VSDRRTVLNLRTNPAAPGPDPALELLRELVAGQRQIIELLERQGRPPKSLSREDRALLARLLPAIGGVMASELFVTRELFEHEAPALRVALGGLTVRKVGRLFQRGEGQLVEGYRIQREGDELHVALWRVVQVPEFLSATNLQVPPATSSGLP
jgi:hypothetical protein